MNYSTSIRIVLKNINKEHIGSINFEIVFTESATKKIIKRFINTHQKIHKGEYAKGKLKQVDRTKRIRQLLERKKVEITEQLRELELIHGNVTPEIYDSSQSKNPDATKTIFELYDGYIKFHENISEPLTVKKHMTAKSLLEEFVLSKGKTNIYLFDINKKFYTDYSDYLKTTKEHAQSTIHKYQGCLKAFLKYLTDELKLNKDEVHKGFKKVSLNEEEGSKVVLLHEHVNKLLKWKPTEKRLELVCDLFLFQIFTGIRYSDLKNVNKSYIVNNCLSFQMYKTTRTVSIPLHNTALIILKKYNYEMGKQCKTLQNYNEDIKTVCKNAGLTEEIVKLKIKLNRKVNDNTPLYKLVSTHVGRTTFITNCLIAGISPPIVMEYSGHKDINTLMGYMRIAGSTSQEAFKKFEAYFTF